MKKIVPYLLLGAVLFLMGCLQEERKLVLNPDGSGKLFYKKVTAGGGGVYDDPRASARATIESITGVEEWDRVRYNREVDGKVYFEGIAYFPDITKLVFQKQIYGRGAGASIEGDLGFLNFSCSKNAAGNWEFSFYDQKEKLVEDSEEEDTELTEKDIQDMVANSKQQWEGSIKRDVESHLRILDSSLTMEFSGEVILAANVEKEAENRIKFSTKGARVMELLEKMHTDAAWAKEIIKERGALTTTGVFPESLKNKRNEILFGKPEPLKLIIKPGEKMLFDYRAEIEEIKNRRRE